MLFIHDIEYMYIVMQNKSSLVERMKLIFHSELSVLGHKTSIFYYYYLIRKSILRFCETYCTPA